MQIEFSFNSFSTSLYTEGNRKKGFCTTALVPSTCFAAYARVCQPLIKCTKSKSKKICNLCVPSSTPFLDLPTSMIEDSLNIEQ